MIICEHVGRNAGRSVANSDRTATPDPGLDVSGLGTGDAIGITDWTVDIHAPAASRAPDECFTAAPV
jgi:hypothetical protein